MPDEQSLVRQAQAGDSQAFATLYEEYFDRVYRYIAVRVGNQTEAEDLTQQVFLKCLESIGGFRWRGAPFASWLFRVAHNVVIDHYRQASRRQTLPLDEFIVADESPEELVDFKLEVEEVKRAIARLTDAQRQVIALRFASGLSISESARAMGKSEGAIKALQHSALQALKRILRTK